MNIFTLMGTILVDNQKANESISKTGEESEKLVTKIDKGITNVAKVGVAIGATAIAAGTAMGGMAVRATEAAMQIEKFANQANLSTDEYQKLDGVMKNSGWSMEQAAGDFSALSEKIMEASEGTGEAYEMFSELGVQTKNLDGSLRSTGDVFNETILALQNITNETERSAIASVLLGTTGEELATTLSMTNQEFLNMKDNINVIDEEKINQAKAFNETWNNVKTTFSVLFTELGLSLIPLMQEVSTKIMENMPEIQKNLNDVFEIVSKIIMFVVEHSAGVMLFSTIMAGILVTLKGYLIIQQITELMKKWELVTKLQTAAQWLLNTAMEANVIGLVVIAIAAVVAGLIYWISKNDELKNKIIELSKTIIEDFKKTLEWFAGLPKKLYENGKEAMQNFFDGFKEPWQKFEDWINDKLGWLEVKVAKYDVSGTKAQDAAGGKKRVDGSHANGLEYVPYDGYVAELHKGEKVLTAKEVEEAKKNKASGDIYYFTIDSKNVKEFNDIIEIVKNKRRVTRMGVSEN